MILTNPEHMPSGDALKNDLPCPSGVSALNTPLNLWNGLIADECGSLMLFSGARGPDPRRLLARAERYFSWPDEAGSAAEWALAASNRDRESYFCAHLLTKKRRIKENAVPLRSLYVDGDRAYPDERLPQFTAIIESSPRRLQMWWLLDPRFCPRSGRILTEGLPTTPPQAATSTLMTP
jgi:hypothetical protein